MKEFILNEDNNYMWIVHDLDAERIYLYYDGETARQFLLKEQSEMGHRLKIWTQEVVDLL